MDLPHELHAAFPPSNHQLLDVARAYVDDDMLEEIARADYGCDAELHLAALRPIRDSGIMPASLGWQPREVLQLIRWSNPEDPNHKPGSTGRRGHQMRAFACAVLLRAAGESGEDDGSMEATLAQCLSSAKALGDEMNNAAAAFLTWGIPRLACQDQWLFALSLIVVASRFRPDRISEEMMCAMTAWVFAEEEQWRERYRLTQLPHEMKKIDEFEKYLGDWERRN